MEDPTEEPDLRAPGAAEEPAGEAGAAGLAGEEGPAGGEHRAVSAGQGPAGGEQGRVSGGARPATGEPRVDAALARLDELEGLPVTEHRAVFEDVHRRLRDVLGELDAGQVPAAGPATAGQAAAARGAAHPARPGRLGR
jgi:hypothetical protein